MDSSAGPLQDFELRVFQAERSGSSEPALPPEDFAAAIASAGGPAIDTGPPRYKAEVVTGDGRRVVVELGALPKRELQYLTDPRAYGSRLFSWLLPPPLINELRDDSDVGEGAPAGLFGSDPSRTRLRLTLDLRDPELHTIRWEYLWDPSAALPVSIQTSFSRFLRVRSARAWPIVQRPLRMVTVLSNPTGLQEFDLARFDEPFHKHLVSNAARPVGPLVDLGKTVYNPTPADLQAVLKRPAGEEFHIVHLVAHSIVEGDHSFLLMAGSDGHAQMVAAEAIRDSMRSITPPHLVFLAAPVTRGEVDGTGLLRLAPMLLATGVQAVVVIPAQMSADALQIVTDCFYERLFRSGVIDAAASYARKRLFDTDPSSPDWGRLVLYQRTTESQLFLDAGIALESALSQVSFFS